MTGRDAGVVLLAVALAGCHGRRVPAASRHLPAAFATPPSDAALLRVSRTGGTVQVLHASSLVPQEQLISGLPPIARLLGASSEEKTIYGADNAGRLVAIDLVARRSHLVSTSARDLSAAPDGTIIGEDSARHPVRFANRTLTTFKATVDKGTTLLRGPGDQLLALRPRTGTLDVLSENGERRINIPSGRIATTWAGDLVAVTTDTAVILVDPSARAPTRPSRSRNRSGITSIRIRGTPVVSAFSPSGHRLYVARKLGGLMMLDRFTRTELRELPLPGIAAGLRADRSGRWLLAHNAMGDSLWVIDLSRWTVTLSRASSWSDDLPTVVAGHILLVRSHGDVVAIDLDDPTSGHAGVVTGGAGDLYIMLPWLPLTAVPATTVATAAPPPPPPPIAVPPDTAETAPPPPAIKNDSGAHGDIYLQVSSSQNSEWAQAFARQLKDGGFPSKVVEPKTSDENYRVMVGPYPSREAAESVGKRLGRSYFIVMPGSGGP
ncbi:MAG: SPOR domain-containing protein [Gemmatimonadales bacterium]